METSCVFFEVQAKFLNVSKTSISFKGLTGSRKHQKEMFGAVFEAMLKLIFYVGPSLPPCNLHGFVFL
jgi:hypothetical protein